MINSIAAQMQKEIWAMEPVRLEAMFSILAAKDFGLLQDISAKMPAAQMRIENDTAVIPITGVLMKSVPWYFSIFGIAATQYSDIIDMLAQAVANSSIKSILLYIDSPGGQVAGGMETADAIRNAAKSKTVNAYIEDLGASGAYWLASQAGHIKANPNAMVGSIGVYTVYIDWSKFAESVGAKVHVIRSGEHKGMGVEGAPITENQIAAMQETIDGMAGHFKSEVATGRKMSAEKVAELATGRVWLAPAAKENGLIDEVGLVANIKNSNNSNQIKGDVTMDEKNQTTAPSMEAITAESKKQADLAIAADRQRLSAMKTAFPKDLAFALEQYEAGATVEQAKAKYCDVLMAKQPEKKAAVTAGAAPIAAGGEGGETQGDFMEQAKAISIAEKTTMTAAMQKLARENPQLHADFVEKCRAGKKPLRRS